MGSKGLMVALVVAGLAGCASAPKQEVADCTFPGTNDAAPGWICDEPVEGLTVSAVGSATKSAAGPGFMKQMAAADARVQLAQNMKVQVRNMIKQFVETTGAADAETVDRVNTSVSKLITDETLTGTRIYKSRTAPDGTLFVLVGLDANAVQAVAEHAIKTSMNNERALWQKFQAKKAQDELAEEISKMKVEMEN